jgi:putative cell wall-binding protein
VCQLAAGDTTGFCPSGSGTAVPVAGTASGPDTAGLSTSTFTSAGFVPSAPGAGTTDHYCFAAEYTPNANYNSAIDNETGTGSGTAGSEVGTVDTPECFAVAGAGAAADLSNFTTTATESPAGTFTDKATATGTAGTDSGTAASVKFFVCKLPAGSDSGFCPAGTGTAVPVAGTASGPDLAGLSTSTFTSAAFIPTTPAAGATDDYCFAAEYTPNANYNSATDNETGTGTGTSSANLAVDDPECFEISGPAVIVVGGGTSTGGGGGASSIGVNRIGGTDRIDTADLVSQATYAAGGAGAVVLARSDLFPDPLAGTPLAVLHHAPILLTPPKFLDPRTAAEIQRVLAGGGTVYLLGQTDALSNAVKSSVAALGYNTVRIGGLDRFVTATDIGNALGTITRIFIANGINFPDALAGAAASGAGGTAIVLTNGTAMPAVSAAFMGAHPGVALFDIGGPAAGAQPTGATLLVGADRYETSVLVAQQFFTKPTGAGVATGVNFPDALTAGPYLVSLNWPMLLSDPNNLPTTVSNYLTSIKPTVVGVTVFGGVAAVSATVFNQLVALMS